MKAKEFIEKNRNFILKRAKELNEFWSEDITNEVSMNLYKKYKDDKSENEWFSISARCVINNFLNIKKRSEKHSPKNSFEVNNYDDKDYILSLKKIVLKQNKGEIVWDKFNGFTIKELVLKYSESENNIKYWIKKTRDILRKSNK